MGFLSKPCGEVGVHVSPEKRERGNLRLFVFFDCIYHGTVVNRWSICRVRIFSP
jgi:hypothetical protein